MDQVTKVVPLRSFEEPLRGLDVVADKLFRYEPSDLCVPDDERVAAGQPLLPVIVAREIRAHDADGRLTAFENGGIRAVLVDGDNIAESALHEPRYEILTDETCSTCDDDSVFHRQDCDVDAE